MKKIFLLLVMATTFYGGMCQTTTLGGFEQQRIGITKKGMLALGSWSAANIIAGAIGTGSANREAHYFHQMNMIWGGTNLLFAGLGYWGASKEKTDGATLSSVLLHQNKIEKTFLFNAGLDVAYIATGLYLRERSRRNADPSKLKGYGNSVMMQGGALLLFDAIIYTLHNKHGKKLSAFTDKFTVMAAPGGVSLAYQL